MDKQLHESKEIGSDIKFQIKIKQVKDFTKISGTYPKRL